MNIISLVLILLISGVVIAIPCCVWGWAVNKVVKNRGYDENWFWWGFFFGLIALIVALTKPQKVYDSNKQVESNNDKFAEVKKYKDLMDSGIITEEEFDKKRAEILGL